MQAISDNTDNWVYLQDMPIGRPPTRKRTPFGERIALAREQAGLSQKQLAANLGVSSNVLSWWEREPVALRPDQIAALASALEVGADFLLGLDVPKPRATGPAGKARLLFDRVSRLPRSQQQRILATVEDMLIAQSTKRSG